MSARILLIDDDRITQSLFRGFLAGRGYAVDAADNAMSGIELLRRDHYDLVLVDFHLPDIDGLVSARMMRDLTEDRLEPTKFAAVTADREGLTARAGSNSVFDGLLAKPVDAHALLGFVTSILDPGREHTPARAAAAFLRQPQHERGKSAAMAFWRARGLAYRPRAAVLPQPRPEQIAALELCFDICEPQAADIVLLLGRDGLADLAALRNGGTRLLIPAVDAGDEVSGAAETAFRVGDPDSWSRVAELIQGFAQRRAQLRDNDDGAADERLLAYLYLVNRTLRIARSPEGDPIVMDSCGFGGQTAAAAAERLCSRGLPTHRVQASDCEPPVDVYGPSERGVAALTVKSSGAASDVDGERLRILVAIESSVNREITARMVESAGYRAETASSGTQAVGVAIEGRHDILLLDSQMTAKDGTPAIRAIRAGDAGARRRPVIALSANVQPAAVAALQEAGFDAVLARPFLRDDLLAAIGAASCSVDVYAQSKFDRDTYDDLLTFLDEADRDALLAQFETQIADLVSESADAAGEGSRFAAVAHELISAAGMLGFMALSQQCRASCDRVRGGEAVSDCSELQSVASATLRCIASLRGQVRPIAFAAA